MKIFSEFANLNEDQSQDIAEKLQNYVMRDEFLEDPYRVMHLREYIAEVTPYKVDSHENALIEDKMFRYWRNRFPDIQQNTKQQLSIDSLENNFRKRDYSEMTVKEILDSLNL